MSKIGITTKKAVALAAAATMTAGALPATAFADENIPEENIVSGEVEPQEPPETLPAQQPEGEPTEEEQEKKSEQKTPAQEEEPAPSEDESGDKQEEGEPAAQSDEVPEEADPQQGTGTTFTVSTDDELQAALASAENGQGRTHEFTGWSVSPESSFTENAEIAPTYGEKMVYSTIKFVDSVTGTPFGEVMSPDGYALDASLVPTPAPTITHDGKTYKFTSWNEDPVGYHVDGDKTFTANYELVGEPENPDNPSNPGGNGDDTGSDNDGTGSNNGSDGNRIENIKDDPTALCEQNDEQKLHQTGDEIPYAVGGGIIAALVAVAAVVRRKFRE